MIFTNNLLIIIHKLVKVTKHYDMLGAGLSIRLMKFITLGTTLAHLLLKGAPFHAGCWGECPLSDKEVPFVWPQPQRYLPAAAALPHSPRDPLHPCPGSAHYNQDARCHSLALFWMAESACCPARHSCHQLDQTLSFPAPQRDSCGREVAAVAGCCTSTSFSLHCSLLGSILVPQPAAAVAAVAD